jgi:hypothetical protein
MKFSIVFVAVLVSFNLMADTALTQYNADRVQGVEAFTDIEKRFQKSKEPIASTYEQIQKKLEEQSKLFSKTVEEAALIQDISNTSESTRRNKLLHAKILFNQYKNVKNRNEKDDSILDNVNKLYGSTPNSEIPSSIRSADAACTANAMDSLNIAKTFNETEAKKFADLTADKLESLASKKQKENKEEEKKKRNNFVAFLKEKANIATPKKDDARLNLHDVEIKSDEERTEGLRQTLRAEQKKKLTAEEEMATAALQTLEELDTLDATDKKYVKALSIGVDKQKEILSKVIEKQAEAATLAQKQCKTQKDALEKKIKQVTKVARQTNDYWFQSEDGKKWLAALNKEANIKCEDKSEEVRTKGREILASIDEIKKIKDPGKAAIALQNFLTEKAGPGFQMIAEQISPTVDSCNKIVGKIKKADKFIGNNTPSQEEQVASAPAPRRGGGFKPVNAPSSSH